MSYPVYRCEIKSNGQRMLLLSIVMATIMSGYISIPFLLFNISSKSVLYLDCCLISPKFIHKLVSLFVSLMVFSATVNNISAISWQSVLLVEEIGGPNENPRPVASH